MSLTRHAIPAGGMLQFVVTCNVIAVGGLPYHITTAKWMQGLTVALRAVCLTDEGNGWMITHDTASYHHL